MSKSRIFFYSFQNHPTTFPPSDRNVNKDTLNDSQRTNNQTEVRNYRFSKLLNRSHPSRYMVAH